MKVVSHFLLKIIYFILGRNKQYLKVFCLIVKFDLILRLVNSFQDMLSFWVWDFILVAFAWVFWSGLNLKAILIWMWLTGYWFDLLWFVLRQSFSGLGKTRGSKTDNKRFQSSKDWGPYVCLAASFSFFLLTDNNLHAPSHSWMLH